MGSAMRAGPRDRGGVAMCAEELDFIGDLVWTGPRGRVAPCGWGTLCAVPYGYDWAPWTGPYVVYFAFYENCKSVTTTLWKFMEQLHFNYL